MGEELYRKDNKNNNKNYNDNNNNNNYNTTFSWDLPPGIFYYGFLPCLNLLHLHPSHRVRILPIHLYGGGEGSGGGRRGWEEKGAERDHPGLPAGNVSAPGSFSLSSHHVLLLRLHAGKRSQRQGFIKGGGRPWGLPPLHLKVNTMFSRGIKTQSSLPPYIKWVLL